MMARRKVDNSTDTPSDMYTQRATVGCPVEFTRASSSSRRTTVSIQMASGLSPRRHGRPCFRYFDRNEAREEQAEHIGNGCTTVNSSRAFQVCLVYLLTSLKLSRAFQTTSSPPWSSRIAHAHLPTSRSEVGTDALRLQGSR